MSSPLPRLRAVDVSPLELEGRPAYVLRDRDEPDGEPVVLTQHGLLLASLLDGQRDVGAVRAAFLLQTGAVVTPGFIESFVGRLDQANLVESARYFERRAEQLARFRAAPRRQAVHAGGAYPGGVEELSSYLERFYVHEEGPGAPPGAPAWPALRGMVAPHVDIHRGGPTYAWGYRALAESEQPDFYLLLGTCHTEMETPLAATRKPYDTPFGPAPVDEAFLDALEAAYEDDLFADELRHRAEHSLEFQAVYLRYLGRVGGEAGPGVATVLCGSLHRFVAEDELPTDSPAVAGALAALREALRRDGRRACVVAGADLAHIGPQFGDASPVTRGTLERLGEGDAEMLELMSRGDADGFYRQVMRDRDARRICGLAPIYYLLALLGPSSGEVLKYTQWVDQRGNGCVTFASVVFPGA